MRAFGGKQVRWVRPEGMHLTLHFLGDIAREGTDRIDAVLAEEAAKVGPFRVRFRGLGAFPHFKRPRVFWVGLEAGEEIAALHRGIGRGIEPLGYRVEKRSFRPHLTLGRVRSLDGIDPLLRAMQHEEGQDFGEGEIREVVLFQSELGPGGARYTPLHQRSLGRARPG